MKIVRIGNDVHIANGVYDLIDLVQEVDLKEALIETMENELKESKSSLNNLQDEFNSYEASLESANSMLNEVMETCEEMMKKMKSGNMTKAKKDELYSMIYYMHKNIYENM